MDITPTPRPDSEHSSSARVSADSSSDSVFVSSTRVSDTLGSQHTNNAAQNTNNAAPVVTVMSRVTCGSCARVIEQIRPVVAAARAELQIIDVDSAGEAIEFGDRVPVILIDDEEFACWEVDNAELAAALATRT